jgi:hypothetical protein
MGDRIIGLVGATRLESKNFWPSGHLDHLRVAMLKRLLFPLL